MTDSLDITVRELPPIRVVMMEHKTTGMAGDYSASIGMMFRELEGWLKIHKFETDLLHRYGVPHTVDGHLVSYWCCIEAPDGLLEGGKGVTVGELAGGRYAVLSLVKDSEIIGSAIDRFYNEYVPAHGLELDNSRHPIEVYYHERMEYCAPVL